MSYNDKLLTIITKLNIITTEIRNKLKNNLIDGKDVFLQELNINKILKIIEPYFIGLSMIKTYNSISCVLINNIIITDNSNKREKTKEIILEKSIQTNIKCILTKNKIYDIIIKLIAKQKGIITQSKINIILFYKLVDSLECLEKYLIEGKSQAITNFTEMYYKLNPNKTIDQNTKIEIWSNINDLGENFVNILTYKKYSNIQDIKLEFELIYKNKISQQEINNTISEIEEDCILIIDLVITGIIWKNTDFDTKIQEFYMKKLNLCHSKPKINIINLDILS